MSHNPPRVWFTAADVRRVKTEIDRKRAQWCSLAELAEKMLANAKAGKRVVLSPATAEYVAAALLRIEKPGSTAGLDESNVDRR